VPKCRIRRGSLSKGPRIFRRRRDLAESRIRFLAEISESLPWQGRTAVENGRTRNKLSPDTLERYKGQSLVRTYRAETQSVTLNELIEGTWLVIDVVHLIEIDERSRPDILL
jgi:hypothetical protein